MNHTANQQRIGNDSAEIKRRGIFQRRIARPLLVMAWFVVGIACVLLVVFFFYPGLNTPGALLSNLKNGPKVIRTKIPEEIKNAANIYRGKIPAANHLLKQAIKIKNTIVVAKQTMPFQSMVTLPEQRETQQVSDLRPPIESPPNKVTIPPVAKTLPPQPISAAAEHGEPKQQSSLHSPIESKIRNETEPPVTTVLPSQPVIVPPKKREPNQKPELLPPMESPTVNETKPSVAKAMPSQPPVASPDRSEPGQEAQSHQPLESQLKMEPMVPAEEPFVSSQATAPRSERKERLENTDPRQPEVRPQPVKEGFKEKTEERIIQSEKWLLSQKPSHYTIQIMGVRNEALLFDFVESAQLLEQNEIAFYQTTFKDKPWFQLLYGVYPTKKDAQSAADAFAPKIRKSSPWIRRLSAVQKAIRKHTAR